MRYRQFRWLLMAACFSPLATCLAQQKSSDDSLGSTATLEYLQNPNREAKSRGVEMIERSLESLVATPAKEPVPAFKYRFWPARTSLKAGMAQTHFYRALVNNQSVLQGMTEEAKHLLSDLQGLEMHQMRVEDLRPWVDRFAVVYGEIDGMATSDDISWDIRFRDLRGAEIWNIRLEDVQQARSLARLLSMKIAMQIADKDFEGASKTIREGFRLAELVGQGESLIQSLVGVAIENIMYEAIDLAIRSPDCPSFYWALATLPPSLTDIRSAVEIELDMAMRTFPFLEESQVLELSDTELTERLRQSISIFGDLSSNGSAIGAGESFGILLSLSGSDAKRRLRVAGIEKAKLDKMSKLQAALIEAGRELRIHSDQLLKGSKLPGPNGDKVRERVNAEFTKWIAENRGSPAAVIASLLFPALIQVHEAEVRSEFVRKRLLTAEAIRLYAGSHNGELPKSLDELSEAPAFEDPFTRKPFDYRVEVLDDRQVVTLSSELPERFRYLTNYKIAFPKAGSRAAE